jgi:hypothetical protein
MSRNTLVSEQFNYIKNYMNFDRLVTLDDVYKTELASVGLLLPKKSVVVVLI